MATIEKRVRNGKTTYRVRYRDPAGSQRSRVFARKADAQRFLNETETAKARGTWTDPALGRVLFRDWLGEWWATTTNLRPKTRDRDELLLRRLALPSFGAVPLAAIVASAPNTGRAGGRAVHNTLATIRSKTGLQV
jgi:hypothetical protein